MNLDYTPSFLMSHDVAATLASIIKTLSFPLAVIQLWRSHEQSKTNFEDSLTQQYREIIKNIPIDVLLGEEIVYGKYKSSLDHFYRYIDLCNEQVFLRQEDRIRKSTWKNWQEGIQSNLNRPAFEKAWKEIKGRSSEDSFTELKRLEECGFCKDPLEWNKGIKGWFARFF